MSLKHFPHVTETIAQFSLHFPVYPNFISEFSISMFTAVCVLVNINISLHQQYFPVLCILLCVYVR